MTEPNMYDDVDVKELMDDILGSHDDTDTKASYKIDKEGTPMDNFTQTFDRMAEMSEDLEEACETKFDGSTLENCDAMLDLNKEIISHLLDLKEQITSMLEKCESKLELLESGLRGNSSNGSKVLVCNAAAPYFKDRDLFPAPYNRDEILKEERGELQVENLPKIYSWTAKDRNTLVKAIRQEAIANLLQPKEPSDSDTDDETCTRKSLVKRKDKSFLPKGFREMVGPLGSREFDWDKIAKDNFGSKHSDVACRVMWNVYLHPDINKNPWSKSEDAKLKDIAKRSEYQDWDKIAEKLGTRRTAYQCFIRYNTTKKLPKVTNCTWDTEEDERLVRLVEAFKIGDFIPWGEVASWMRSRTKQQVYFRFTYSLAPDLVKGRFTKREENELKQAVTRYGKNFPKISSAVMPNRSTIQLNDHYQRLATNAVQRPNVWTPEDDAKLLRLYEKLGPNWSKIAEDFSNKSRTQVRHRHTALRKCISKGIPVHDLRRGQNRNQTQNEIENQVENRRPGDLAEKERAAAELESTYAGNDSEECEEDDEEILDEIGEGGTESYSVEDGRLKYIQGMQFKERDFRDDVDKELIDYFRMVGTKKEPGGVKKEPASTQETSSSEQLEPPTRQLYHVLRILNAKLEIPDDLDRLEVSDRNKRLLRSLKKYSAAKEDERNKEKAIELCGSRMFRSGCNEDGSRFVPPLPFDSQIRSRKSKKGESIDYGLNTTRNFLMETSMELETPEFVTKYLGKEDELEFEKVGRIFMTISSKPISTNVVKKLYIRPPDVLHRKSTANATEQRDASKDTDVDVGKRKKVSKLANEQVIKSVTANSLLVEESTYYSSIPFAETAQKVEEKTPAVDVTYATLLGLKNIMYLKRLFGPSDKTDRNNDAAEAEEFLEAYNLLETRLKRLFQYPLGLSKTILPKLYGTGSLFLYDHVPRKRKVSCKSTEAKKKVRGDN